MLKQIKNVLLLFATIQTGSAMGALPTPVQANMTIHVENGKKFFYSTFDPTTQTGFFSVDLDWSTTAAAVKQGYELSSSSTSMYNSPNLPDACNMTNITGALLDGFQANSTIRIDFQGDCAQYFQDLTTMPLQIEFGGVRHLLNTTTDAAVVLSVATPLTN